MANTTTYTDEQRADALAKIRANRGNLLKTSRQTGIPRGTLRGWAGTLGNSSTAQPAVVPDEAQRDARSRLALSFRSTAQALVDAVDDEKLAKAGVRDLLVAAGIATDKAELLTGGPTSRVQQLQVTLIGAGSLAELGGAVLKALNPGLPSADSVASRDTLTPR